MRQSAGCRVLSPQARRKCWPPVVESGRSARACVGLVELDQVAVRIVEEGLQARADRHGGAHREAPPPQLRNRRVEVGDEERKVLSMAGRHRSLDEMDL